MGPVGASDSRTRSPAGDESGWFETLHMEHGQPVSNCGFRDSVSCRAALAGRLAAYLERQPPNDCYGVSYGSMCRRCRCAPDQGTTFVAGLPHRWAERYAVEGFLSESRRRLTPASVLVRLVALLNADLKHRHAQTVAETGRLEQIRGRRAVALAPLH